MLYNDSKVKARNRKKIVNEAVQLFNEKGISNTTVKSILTQCELERQTFYNYFEDKEKLTDYIYVSALRKFYTEDFSDSTYNQCKNGYEKLKRYFNIVLENYFDNIIETVFLVHYDYYYGKEPNMQLIQKIYSEKMIIDPTFYFIEGIKDGSISDDNNDPWERFYVLAQSFGSYANRVIYRAYHSNSMDMDLQKERLRKVVEMILRDIKND